MRGSDPKCTYRQLYVLVCLPGTRYRYRLHVLVVDVAWTWPGMYQCMAIYNIDTCAALIHGALSTLYTNVLYTESPAHLGGCSSCTHHSAAWLVRRILRVVTSIYTLRARGSVQYRGPSLPGMPACLYPAALVPSYGSVPSASRYRGSVHKCAGKGGEGGTEQRQRSMYDRKPP